MSVLKRKKLENELAGEQLKLQIDKVKRDMKHASFWEEFDFGEEEDN